MPVEGEKLFHGLRVCVSWANFERKDFFNGLFSIINDGC